MSWFIENFKLFDDKIAIIYDNHTYTYKELYSKIETINNTLLLDIKSGEVVSILADYSFESITLLIALYNNKNIIVPITTNIQKEITDRIQESYTNKIIKIENTKYILENTSQEEKHTMIDDLQVDNHAGLILFSSGSTGKPKAMIHNLDNLIDNYKDKKAKSLNMVLFLMFDHIGGLNTLFNILSMSATMVIPNNRNVDDVCKLLQDYKIRILPSSPTFLNLILMNKSNKKYDLSSLRMVTYGTETMPESLLIKLKANFPKAKFLQTFGTSETGIANTSSKSSNSTFMKIDDPELQYKIVENELWLKSKTQVMGYLNSSMESFTEDGWFKTGDLVETTEDGFIKIIGRSKEVINVGGEKVLPNEVESVILQINEIDDVMVYAEQNIITGQTVVCEVVTLLEKKDAKRIIRKFCKNLLADFKIPTKVNVVDKTNFSSRFKKIRIKT